LPDYKCQTISDTRYLNKQMFGYHKIGYWLLFSYWCLAIGVSNGYALSLDKPRVSFLKGDYKAAIFEGEKLMAVCRDSGELDELYYILALSYLKDGNYLRAWDIFEIILNEAADSRFKEEAILGLGDVYFLREDFRRSGQYYEKLLKEHPDTKLKAQAYYRLAQVGFRAGDNQQAGAYLQKIKAEFPQNIEVRLNNNLPALAEIYYTVQVGSFSEAKNAERLADKLKERGYPAYSEETASRGKAFYRVRVGKFKTRYEAQTQEEQLAKEGYPTRIYP